MTRAAGPRVSVSTWALRRALGQTFAGAPGDPDRFSVPPQGPGSGLDLLDVPARLASVGIHTMELCHFHLPTREPAYLAELKSALDQANVELWAVLLDDGDLSHEETSARDRDWILSGIDTASALGARCARVIAGKQPSTPANRRRSESHLRALVLEAYVRGVRVLSENWFALLATPESVHELLGNLRGSVGLCLDWGNWNDHGDAKYDDLAAIADLAESCHAKARFIGPGQIDETDFARCLDLCQAAAFAGPYTLVDGGPGDEWDGIALQRDFLAPHLS